jgi:hypothetical protein
VRSPFSGNDFSPDENHAMADPVNDGLACYYTLQWTLSSHIQTSAVWAAAVMPLAVPVV